MPCGRRVLGSDRPSGSPGVVRCGGRACLSSADGASDGATIASMPTFATGTTPSPSLTSEDLGHTVCVVPATDCVTCVPGPDGCVPSLTTAGPGRNSLVPVVICISFDLC